MNEGNAVHSSASGWAQRTTGKRKPLTSCGAPDSFRKWGKAGLRLQPFTFVCKLAFYGAVKSLASSSE